MAVDAGGDSAAAAATVAAAAGAAAAVPAAAAAASTVAAAAVAARTDGEPPSGATAASGPAGNAASDAADADADADVDMAAAAAPAAADAAADAGVPATVGDVPAAVAGPDNKFGAGTRATGKLLRADGSPMLHVVFVSPQIPWNTGNIGRTCLGLGVCLHLVPPISFSLSAAAVRRAGLDYWWAVDVTVHESWAHFRDKVLPGLGDAYFYTKHAAVTQTDVEYDLGRGVVLLFGSETDGFDSIAGQWEDVPGATPVAFPMVEGDRFRAFNLSTSASMAVWDAYRQVTLGRRAAAKAVATVQGGAGPRTEV